LAFFYGWVKDWRATNQYTLDMGVSENGVPLNPMVNDHYPYEMAIIGNIPYFQTNPYGYGSVSKPIDTIFNGMNIHKSQLF